MLSPWIIYKLINLAIYLSIKYIPQSNILIIWIWLKKKILCHKKMLSMKNWTSKIKFNKIYQNDRFDLSNRLRTLNTDDPAKSRLTFDSFLSLSRYKLLKVVSTSVQVSFHEKRKKKRERGTRLSWFPDLISGRRVQNVSLYEDGCGRRVHFPFIQFSWKSPT